MFCARKKVTISDYLFKFFYDLRFTYYGFEPVTIVGAAIFANALPVVEPEINDAGNCSKPVIEIA